METYLRKEHYNHYAESDHCTYSITSGIDVTSLVAQIKADKKRFYPTFIYVVTKAVNAISEFKMAIENDILGIFDYISASYLIFHEDDKTFSCAFTEYNEDFDVFYNSIISDMNRYKDVKGFEAMDYIPANTFPVSCIPWISYTAMNLNMPYSHNFYAPIITWGKFEKQADKLILPLTVQINHAVADGYHTSMLFNDVQKICDDAAWLEK